MVTRTKYYTPQEYKDMPAEQLVDTFRPLIAKLGRAFGDGRFNEDIEADCVLELLRCRDRFDPSVGSRFPSWANIYLRWAAKCSKMRHCSPIQISYTRYVTGQADGRPNPQNTVNLRTCADEPGVELRAIPQQDYQLADDTVDAVMAIIADALYAAYTDEECTAILMKLGQVYRGEGTLTCRERTKLRRALHGTVLADKRLMAGVMRSLALDIPSEHAECGDEQEPVIDSAYHPYDHELV